MSRNCREFFLMKGRAGQKDPRAERGGENYRENRGACEFDGSAKC